TDGLHLLIRTSLVEPATIKSYSVEEGRQWRYIPTPHPSNSSLCRQTPLGGRVQMLGTRQMRPSAYCSKNRAGAASGELQPNMRKIAKLCKPARSREAIADAPCCCREITEIALF